jgi:hypothetical protein
MRWAFNRLLESTSRDEIKRKGQELFGLNSRYADDARLKAQAVLDSQKELLELEAEETEKKLGRARKKLGQAMRKLTKAEEKGTAPGTLEKLRLAVKGRNNRVASLEEKLAEFKAYQENGTIPKVVFGGKKLWKKVCKGCAVREEWQAVRRNRILPWRIWISAKTGWTPIRSSTAWLPTFPLRRWWRRCAGGRSRREYLLS